MRRLLKFWFSFEGQVGRREYLLHGLALMAFKYATDALLIWATTGQLWVPTNYLSGVSLAGSPLASASSVVRFVLAAWTVPFMWAGLTLTSRRAVDARVSPWLSLLFVIPFVNYLAMGVLCLLPTAEGPAAAQAKGERGRFDELKAILAATVTGWVLLFASVTLIQSYGMALFVGTPFVMGAVAGWLLNRNGRAAPGRTGRAILLSVIAAAAGILLFAGEGFVCVFMAFPIALAIAWLGGRTGRYIAMHDNTSWAPVALVFLLPVATPLIDANTPVMTREVRTVIEIAAPPDVVWRNVVTFPRIPETPSILFSSGIAVPLGARIEGSGVGAIRYCIFSTGEFVEPITGWEPGKRLAFDIIVQPDPMRELSPYGIRPPHLNGYFRATRGEFTLEQTQDGRTRVVGRTWYALNIHPAPWFALFADAIVSQIHNRVLGHIKGVAEADARR